MDENVNSLEIKEYIKEIGVFFWWVPEKDKENLSLDSVVEATLNYVTIEQIKKLFGIIGIEEVARIFYKNTSGFRTNYFPRTKHFFNLYFQKNVQGYSDKKSN